MKKQRIALLLAVMLLVSLLAGCATETVAPVDTSSQVTESSANSTAETTDEPEQLPSENLPEESEEKEPTEEKRVDSLVDVMNASTLEPITLPITEELTTYTVFAYAMYDATMGYENPNELPFWIEAEERTNIHFDWTIANEISAQFSLMLVAEEYTDIAIGCHSVLPNGFDYQIEEEIIMDLSELVPKYAPHYNELLNADSETRKASYTDGGHLPGIWVYQVDPEMTFMGWSMRGDWLEQIGFEGTPETYADWTNILQGFQENGLGYLHLPVGQFDDLGIGYGARNSLLLDENGQIYHGALSDEYRAYLTMFADWYAKGYVNFDLDNALYFNYDFSEFYGGKAGIIYGLYTFYDYNMLFGGQLDPNFCELAVPFPTVNETDDLSCYSLGMSANNMTKGNCTMFFTACEDPGTLLQWFDYFCTPEGYMLANYGIEGTSYVMVDGQPDFTELMSNNENGYTQTQMIGAYCGEQKVIPLYDYHRCYEGLSEGSLAELEVWHAEYETAIVSQLPSVTLNVEESETLGSKYNDIKTYISEYTLRAATGAEDIDATWDSFVANVEAMGIQDCIDIYQAALDRYNTR